MLGYHKGKTAFGGYPGVDECEKAVLAADNDLQETYAEFSASLEDVFEEAETAQNDLSTEQANAVETYNRKVSACYEAHRGLVQAVGRAESECKAEVAQMITLGMALNGKDHPPLDDLFSPIRVFSRCARRD